MLHEAVVPEQSEQDTEFRHILDDGREFSASSRAEAIASCPFLSKLPVEQANVLLELTALPAASETKPIEQEQPATRGEEPPVKQPAKLKPRDELIRTEVAPGFSAVQLEEQTIPEQTTAAAEVATELLPARGTAEIHLRNREEETLISQSALESDPVERTLRTEEHKASQAAEELPPAETAAQELTNHRRKETHSQHAKAEIAESKTDGTGFVAASAPESVITRPFEPAPELSEMEEPVDSFVQKISFEMNVDEEPLEQLTATTELEETENIPELTAELNILFAEHEATSDSSERMPILPELIDDLAVESADPAKEEKMTAELFAPLVLPENNSEDAPEKTLHEVTVPPETIDAVERLQAVIVELRSDPSHAPELTEQIVEDVVAILVHLGHEEPHKTLSDYARTHSLAELFKELEQALPELNKLIDYQQHLLIALGRASGQSDRRLGIAEILTRLLFKSDKRLAAVAA